MTFDPPQLLQIFSTLIHPETISNLYSLYRNHRKMPGHIFDLLCLQERVLHLQTHRHMQMHTHTHIQYTLTCMHRLLACQVTK